MAGEDVGFHPSLAGLKSHFDAGNLAVLHGVEYPDPRFSHAESRRIWLTGDPAGLLGTGWLGRYVGTLPVSDDSTALEVCGSLDELNSILGLARAEALQRIRGHEDLERLVIGFKRAANILKGVDETALPPVGEAEWAGAHPTETRLREAVETAEKNLANLRGGKDYDGMLRVLLELREPIDAFFEDVMVMSENPAERTRRLALLAQVRSLFRDVFDPARIVIEGESAPPA